MSLSDQRRLLWKAAAVEDVSPLAEWLAVGLAQIAGHVHRLIHGYSVMPMQDAGPGLFGDWVFADMDQLTETWVIMIEAHCLQPGAHHAVVEVVSRVGPVSIWRERSKAIVGILVEKDHQVVVRFVAVDLFTCP